MSDQIIARPGWKQGDCRRVSNTRKSPEDHRPPSDVTTTYGHVFLHDPRWAENHCNSATTLPSVYVSVFREKQYVLEDRSYWSECPERVRLVKKEDADFSFVISGIDDFWIEDHGDRFFVVLTNMRKGKKLIRFLLHRDWLPEIVLKLGVLSNS